jgi:lipopolysaccharide heptosyltransferase I
MRIVLVRLSALGDIVHTWPLADALRTARPDAHLSWVVEPALAPLVDGHPAIDAVLTADTRRWRRRPFSARTRAEVAVLKTRFAELEPDLAIDSQGTLKSAAITRWTRARRRVGLARPWRRELLAGMAYTETMPGSAVHRHVVATNLELVGAAGGTPPGTPAPPDGSWLSATAPRVPGAWKRPFAVLLPGAGGADKIVASRILSETAGDLTANGMDVVVAWGPAERDRAAEVVDGAGSRVHLAPPTNLFELAGLLRDAEVVVGGDTGPVHLAASLGTPTVAVFVTTDPERNGPLGAWTAVVSGAAAGRRPTGSARARTVRPVAGNEIRTAVRRLLERAR